MKNSHKIFVLVIATAGVSLNACTNQQMYDAVQQNRLYECRNQADIRDIEQCERRHSMEWKDYEQQRQSLKARQE